MKKCSYCGAEYSDDVLICITDQTPLDNIISPTSKMAGRPWLKIFLIFATGFLACLVCEAVLVFGIYYFYLKPMEDKFSSAAAGGMSPPEFFTPHNAVFKFSATDANGKPFDLSEYRGRVIVLNVWATWCPPCMAELPYLGKLSAHYANDKDVAIVCISEEPTNTVFRNPKVAASGAPVYSTGGERLPAVYQTEYIPGTFIIDKNGMVIFKHVSAANWSDSSVIAFIDSLRVTQPRTIQNTN